MLGRSEPIPHRFQGRDIGRVTGFVANPGLIFHGEVSAVSGQLSAISKWVY